MGFRAKVLAGIVGFVTGTPDVGNARYDFNDSDEIDFNLGTGAVQANGVYTDRFTIAPSGTLELDLAGGGLTDALGQPVNFTAIKAIKLKAEKANTAALVLGGAAANPFIGPFADASDKLSVAPGGVVIVVDPTAAGMTVTASTGDKLLITNAGAAAVAVGTITIIGEV